MQEARAIVEPRKILVLDDSPLVLDVTRLALERAGYAVSTATTVDEFEDARRRAPPDLIIVDVQMPEIFGDDLTGTLRGAYGERAPIVMMSSIDEDELARRASEAGASAWVAKKSGVSALVATVSALFEAPGRTPPVG